MSTIPNLHWFKVSDTPGEFRCPECPAWAHFERDGRGVYCIHPTEGRSDFQVGNWTDERVLNAHTYEMKENDR